MSAPRASSPCPRPSAGLQRRVKQSQLVICWQLEDTSIPFHVALGETEAAIGVTIHDSPDQFVVGHIEETEFDRCAERSPEIPLLVAFGSRPEAPFQDHRRSQREEPLGESRELPFEFDLKLRV